MVKVSCFRQFVTTILDGILKDAKHCLFYGVVVGDTDLKRQVSEVVYAVRSMAYADPRKLEPLFFELYGKISSVLDSIEVIIFWRDKEDRLFITVGSLCPLDGEGHIETYRVGEKV